MLHSGRNFCCLSSHPVVLQDDTSCVCANAPSLLNEHKNTAH